MSADKQQKRSVRTLRFSKGAPANNGKHPGGRPKTYTSEFISALAEEMIEWFGKKPNWWLKDFAIKHRIPPQKFSDFAKQSEEFREALTLCNAMQESKLVHKGFIRFQDRMASFALKNVCGWRDAKDISIEPGGAESEYDSVSITIVKSKSTNGQVPTN